MIRSTERTESVDVSLFLLRTLGYVNVILKE